MRKGIYDIIVQLVLIIVGVLSALAVDNYRESIQERKLEKEYLINLRNSIQLDTVMLKTEIERTFIKINAISKLLSLSDSLKEIDEAKFGELITNVIMLIRPNFITAVYDELKFTGNFKLIHNNELKLLIISYYTDNAIIQQENMLNMSGYQLELLDALTFDEMEYKVPFDQKRIFNRIKSSENVRIQLQRVQKTTSHVRSGLIYTSIPHSIDLLDKLEIEINK